MIFCPGIISSSRHTEITIIHKNLYNLLYEYYGPRGWWPLKSRAGTPGFDSRGYHKGNYLLPRTRDEQFEIIIGAILTQNTSWKNVEKAIDQLRQAHMLYPAGLASADPEVVARLIRSSGYYNQKTKKIKIIAHYFLKEKFIRTELHPGRIDLLSLWGIGPETADSILLYAFGEPFFVVDAYTRRLLIRLGCISGKESYDDVQKYFTSENENLNTTSLVHYYNEYHALIVEHAKQHCRKNPVCPGCPVIEYCSYN